jgi:hypothetical protein
MDSIVLHPTKIKEILKWNQEHLDAYLQLADIIIERSEGRAGLNYMFVFIFITWAASLCMVWAGICMVLAGVVS